MRIDDTLFYRVVLTVTVAMIFFRPVRAGHCFMYASVEALGRRKISWIETDESKEDVRPIQFPLQYDLMIVRVE